MPSTSGRRRYYATVARVARMPRCCTNARGSHSRIYRLAHWSTVSRRRVLYIESQLKLTVEFDHRRERSRLSHGQRWMTQSAVSFPSFQGSLRRWHQNTELHTGIPRVSRECSVNQLLGFLFKERTKCYHPSPTHSHSSREGLCESPDIGPVFGDYVAAGN